MKMNPRSYHLPEKFLVASIVVRMAPCNREEKAVWGEEAIGEGRGGRDGRGGEGEEGAPFRHKNLLKLLALHFSHPPSPETIPASREKGEAEVS